MDMSNVSWQIDVIKTTSVRILTLLFIHPKSSIGHTVLFLVIMDYHETIVLDWYLHHILYPTIAMAA